MTVAVFTLSLLGAMALGMPIAFALLVCAARPDGRAGADGRDHPVAEAARGRRQLPAAGDPVLHARRRADERRRHLASASSHFALAWVGHIRGGLGLVAIFASVHDGRDLGQRGGRHRGDRHAADPDDARRRLQRAARGRPDRRRRRHRAGDPAVDRLHHVRRHRQRLDRQAVPGRHLPGAADGRCRCSSPGSGWRGATTSPCCRASAGRRARRPASTASGRC